MVDSGDILIRIVFIARHITTGAQTLFYQSANLQRTVIQKEFKLAVNLFKMNAIVLPPDLNEIYRYLSVGIYDKALPPNIKNLASY